MYVGEEIFSFFFCSSQQSAELNGQRVVLTARPANSNVQTASNGRGRPPNRLCLSLSRGRSWRKEGAKNRQTIGAKELYTIESY